MVYWKTKRKGNRLLMTDLMVQTTEDTYKLKTEIEKHLVPIDMGHRKRHNNVFRLRLL